MKNKIIYYSGIAFLMACIGIIIAIAVNYKYENENVKVFKDLLIALDNSNSNKKGYEINFNKNVDYDDIEENDNFIANYNAHYESSGNFKLSYQELDNKINLIDGFQSFFENGNGYIKGNQNESYIITNIEKNKNNNDILRDDNYNYSINNEFIIENNNNIKVFSKTNYIDNLNENNTNDNFSGKIDKNILFNTIELEKFNDAVNQIMFIDVWTDATTLLKLIQKTLSEIDYNNHKELADFIKNNKLNYQVNDNIIKIDYLLDLDDEFNDNENNYECIIFSLEVDKDKKEIRHFSFDLSKYYESILKSDEEDLNDELSKVTNYYIEGKIINDTLDDIDTSDIEYIEYNDETKYDFIDDFLYHAIPAKDELFND